MAHVVPTMRTVEPGLNVTGYSRVTRIYHCHTDSLGEILAKFAANVLAPDGDWVFDEMHVIENGDGRWMVKQTFRRCDAPPTEAT